MWISVPTSFHLTCRHSSAHGTADLTCELTDRKHYTKRTLSQYTDSLCTGLLDASGWEISQDGNPSRVLLWQVRCSLVFTFGCRLKTPVNQLPIYVGQISNCVIFKNCKSYHYLSSILFVWFLNVQILKHCVSLFKADKLPSMSCNNVHGQELLALGHTSWLEITAFSDTVIALYDPRSPVCFNFVRF